MILAGSSYPQRVTITGTGFTVTAKVLVTMPGADGPITVTPLSATTTQIVFDFTFAVSGDYLLQVTDETGACDTCPSEAVSLVTIVPECPDGTAFKTLGQLVTETAHRLGDDDHVIWTAEDLRQAIRDGYRILATKLAVFWDQGYLENLPRGFSVTQPWELLQLGHGGASFNYGVANFTAEFERRLGFDERLHYGPANHTSPFEATDGLLERADASTAIPATAEVPKTLTRLDRATWDERGIDALEPRTFSGVDARYEITAGEVFGYFWQKDGVRTFRKVKVPAQQAETVVVNGSWGILRSPADLSTTTPTGTWGVPRQIEGHHPIGPETFGLPRRPYLDHLNVRIEFFRQGRVLADDHAICELPPRYAVYLRDYARSVCFGTAGPGYDQRLSEHFDQRWQRGLKRIDMRVRAVDTEHTFVMGGDGRPAVAGPPRPKLPWQFGSRVR